MKTTKLLKSLKKRFVQATSTMFSLNKEKSLLGLVRRFSWKVISLALGRQARIAPRVKRVHNLVVFLLKMNKNHGSSVTVKWLKSCQVALQRKVAGSPFTSLRELEPSLPMPRLINGLPAVIGPSDRGSIRTGDTNVIRLWMSIFGFYRILEAPYKPKLETITEASPYINEELHRDFVDFLGSWKHLPIIKVKPARKFMLNNSSGPNGENAAQSMLMDAWVLYQKFPKVMLSLMRYLRLTKSRDLLEFLDDCLGIANRLCPVSSMDDLRFFDPLRKKWILGNGRILSKDELPGIPIGQFRFKSRVSLRTARVGQLSFKEEASGKLRIFAIVDNWTQSAFQPLHDALFQLLKSLPNDGTFDQDASVTRSGYKSKAYGHAWSLDLSAATDRLPISLQKRVLDCIGFPGLGQAWSDVIVQRPYDIPHVGKKYGLTPYTSVFYACGQPMGARSSWAMLAVTHHLILQFCAAKVYGVGDWDERYEILGDDIVIFDQKIKDYYMYFMDQMSVGLSLPKSLPAEQVPAFEFAKRTILNHVDVSGISWKQLISENSLAGRTNLVLSLMKRDLLSSVPVLLVALSRNSKEAQRLPVKSDKTYKAFAHSLVSILGSIMPLEAVVETLVNPHDEEVPLDEFETYPVAQAVTAIFCKMRSEDHSFSEEETRKELVHDELHPALVESLLGRAEESYKRLLSTYDDLILDWAKGMVNHFNSLGKIDKAALQGLADQVILDGEDPDDWFQEVDDLTGSDYWDPMSLTISEALEIYDKSVLRLSRFKYRAVRNVTPQKAWLSVAAIRSLTAPLNSSWKIPDPWFY